MKMLRVALLLGATLCCPAAAFAVTCSGAAPFSDISTSDFFCSEVEWQKNRGVSLGFIDGTYRPNDNVLRSQMALFMKRLAEAILPAPVIVEASTSDIPSLSNNVLSNPLQCEGPAPAIIAANYPRTFTVSTHLSITTAAGVANVAVQPLYSLDGGTTWVFPNLDAEFVGFDSTTYGHVTSEAVFTVPAGKTVMVAQGLADIGFSNPHIMPGGRCHILVRQQSVTGATSPY